FTGRAPVTAARARPTGAIHRPPPPRRTFSSGQRALLWAAGVLGALAIVIAILIVLNAQDRKDREIPPPTVTNTITETTPYQSPTAMPEWLPDWTSSAVIGHGGDRFGAAGPDAAAASAHLRALPAPAQTWLRTQT
ncbi:serine/threonine protein kinase, partial [Mycolicibacterium litorale]